MSSVSWQRQNHIVSLSNEAIHLVQTYAQLQRGLDPKDAFISKDSILERTQSVSLAASTVSAEQNDKFSSSSSNNGAECRCFETGGFLLPTVSKHPWYRSSKDERIERLFPARENSTRLLDHKCRYVLDLGCGFAADARQMLIDGFATHVVGVDRSDEYLRLGCLMFGDDPHETIVPPSGNPNDSSTGETMDSSEPQTLTLIACNVVDTQNDGGFLARISTVLASHQHEIIQPSDSTSNNTNTPLFFDAVYAGKFLHCLETEENFRILLRKLHMLLVPGGPFFGVFGRNFSSPVWECAQRKDFERVLVSEGFLVGMMVEEAAGATWFCAFKN